MNKKDTIAAYSDFTKWCRDNPHLDLDSRLHSHSGPIGYGGYISHEKTAVAFAAWRAALEAARGDYEALQAERDALQAECEKLRKDAERYRYLSSMATQQADTLGPIFRIDVRRTPQTLFNFDAAVDHARRAEGEGE